MHAAKSSRSQPGGRLKGVFSALKGRGLAAGVAVFLALGGAAGAEEDFDPLEGIERDGRIPYVERPGDLPNPERWRYIPEGRIKSGNLFERMFVTSFIAPFVGKSSDAGWGGGIGIGDIDFRNQRRREFAVMFGAYTQERQQAYGMAWRRWLHHIDLPEGGVLQEERSFVSARAVFSKTRTRRFFGFGADTSPADESSYTEDFLDIGFGTQFTLPEPGSNLILRGAVRAELHSLSDGIVSGAPNLEERYPLVFLRDEERNMGWFTAGLRYDTRDSQSNPYRGWYVGAIADAALIQTGGDVGAVFTFSASRVFPIPGLLHRAEDYTGEENPPTDTLLLGLRSQVTAGDLPFYTLPSLGGRDSLRGFIAGRFRDRASWYGSAEYRVWVIQRGFGFSETARIERIGLAAFYGAGSVAGDFAGLFSSSVRHSYGFSVILSIERLFPFRLDFGFSNEDFLITGGAGLTF